MSNFKITYTAFGLWIGLVIAGSVALELSLQDRIYSHQTASMVSIMGITGFISSLLTWRYFARFGQTVFRSSFILSMVNIILFCFFGTLVSYVVIIVFPHLFGTAPKEGHDSFSIIDFLIGIVLGYLGSGFSFKTFGLPLLWPIGVISGSIGTIIFVYINKVLNSGPRH